jgi:hypothetical protein
VVWVISQVLVEVDVIYKGECDSKIGRMDTWVKDNGLVGKKKPRDKAELGNIITSYIIDEIKIY